MAGTCPSVPECTKRTKIGEVFLFWKNRYFKWVPGHRGVEKKERADEFVKHGSSSPNRTPGKVAGSHTWG